MSDCNCDQSLALIERVKVLEEALTKRWNERGLDVDKDTSMPMTEEHFYKIIDMTAELIDEQKTSIENLKVKVNSLLMKNKQGSIDISCLLSALLDLYNEEYRIDVPSLISKMRAKYEKP